MNSERHNTVKRIFLAACALDKNQVAAFLDRECGDDAELRQEVESLLEHHLSATLIERKPIEPPVTEDLTKDQSTPMSATTRQSHRRERFAPGTVVAGRYRIVGVLGRGGMGEVYRADDMKLDRPVALKFLSKKHAGEAWLERFHNEVRLALKVTHPNVNRVYDIGDADGDVFFSMEYVDGEDLASLLKRIGPIAGSKATQIAGQLCAGLGAAHDQGVLHRDLKPANIMIDGDGQVRITDFGIAALADDLETTGKMAGTPIYMAPELFKGEEPSERSDIYSLGIVLYELVTGKHPFDGLPPNHRNRQVFPVRPSEVVSGIDPEMEEIILACLAGDPRRRPDSAYAVASKLPGADPIAVALAAGRTPSPSMVAAAGDEDALCRKSATISLALGLVGLIVVVLLAGRTFFLCNAGLEKPPAVLADKANDILERFGYEPDKRSAMQGFAIDSAYLLWLRSQRKKAGDSPQQEWPKAYFWYRQGDTRLAPPAPLGQPALVRKFAAEPGMTGVQLDGSGRLMRFAAFPCRDRMKEASDDKPDWTEVFNLAGLDFANFKSVEPTRNPPMYADDMFAWQEKSPAEGRPPIVVEGATRAGRVAYFNVVPPWRKHCPESTGSLGRATPGIVFRFLLHIAALCGGVALAWRNVRSGRGDMRGAWRLAAFVFVLAILDWIVGERHVNIFSEEVATGFLWITRSVFAGAVAWMLYMALEVYVRRFWPKTLITWVRVNNGHFRDPLLGRDLLIGGLFGIGIVLVLQFDSLLPSLLGVAPTALKLPGEGYDIGELLGLRYKLGTVVGVMLQAISLGLLSLTILLLIRGLVRIGWLAIVLFCIVLTFAFSAVSVYDTFLPLLTNAVLAAGLALVLIRVGLVAVIVGSFVSLLIMANPVTADFGAWYAPAGTFTIVLVAAILIYGFRLAIGGKPLLPRTR